jgi:glycosyltransferase involved in cell wall biosynthesis
MLAADETQRLRILLSIHYELDPDTGAPGSTLAIANAYSALGHDVRLLSFNDMPFRISRPGSPKNQRSFRFQAAIATYPMFLAARLLREARRDIDVIDSSAGDTWLWAELTRSPHRPLLVARSHGLDHLFHEQILDRVRREGERLSWRYHLYWARWRLLEERRSLRASDLTFVLNDVERQLLTDRLGVPPERVCVTANGLSDEFLAKAGTVNPDPGARAVAYVGNYRVMKGVKYGARALTAAMDSRPDLTASFIGTGVARNAVLADFPTHLHDRIATIEHYRRAELPNLLAGHGILLFPSLSEGFGLSCLEAMACGLAPVATDNAGTVQIVESGRSGLLVPMADATELERALNRLLDDESLRRRLQTAAREVAHQYSWRRIASERIERYREALSRRSASAAT